ncbi:hypothetical protein [Lysobacter sp. CA199]|uniref:hypothetical protein n=1 Tax=Lysobacter sp. CA199 TaxID=3455608 RepID=UPI003F8D4951
MTEKRTKNKSDLAWHPSLKKVFKECERWWAVHFSERGDVTKRLGELQRSIDAPGSFSPGPLTLPLISLGSEIQACILAQTGSSPEFSQAFQESVAFRALEFRSLAGRSFPSDQQPFYIHQHPSLSAAGPAILSQWRLAETCARVLIALGEKDQRVNPRESFRDGWGRGTVEAFVIRLFSDAFAISTTYEPVNALTPEYQALLDAWRTNDEAIYRASMQAAAEFHLTRSRQSTDHVTYEFDAPFDRVFPVELLAVQALRRRDHLPEFQTGHNLVDTPWSVVSDLSTALDQPLVVSAEARLRRDYPEFR